MLYSKQVKWKARAAEKGLSPGGSMMQENAQQDNWKRLAGEAAALLVEDGMVLGLGTGSTATYLLYALAQRIQQGLRIIGGAPTPKATDDGNMIIDCAFAGGIKDAVDLQARLKEIVGVVETGLFLHMVERAIIGGSEGVKTLRREY